jgi:hypothetical protein
MNCHIAITILFIPRDDMEAVGGRCRAVTITAARCAALDLRLAELRAPAPGAVANAVVIDFDADQDTRTFGERGIGKILGLPDDAAGRAMLLALGDNQRSTRLDLIEWQQPRSKPRVRENLTRLGLARICLKVKNCETIYRSLLEAGFTSYTPPTRIELGGSYQIVFCCEDPDGTVIEFMEFVKG